MNLPEHLRFSRDREEYAVVWEHLQEVTDNAMPLADAFVAGQLANEKKRSEWLSPALCPRLHRLLNEVLNKLELTWEPLVFCRSASEMNCLILRTFTLAPETSHLFATSALLDAFSDDEMRFLIGHELGHVIYQHDLLFTLFALGKDELQRKWETSLSALCAYLRWRPAAEVTADRVGLHVCQSLESACMALLKARLGLSAHNLNPDLSAILQEIQQLRASPGNHYKGYPNLHARMWAMHEFSTGVDAGVADGRIADLLYPSGANGANGGDEVDHAVRDLIISVGIDIICADSRLHDVELICLLEILLTRYTTYPERHITWNHRQLQAMKHRALVVLKNLASPKQRANVITILGHLVHADSHSTASEYAAVLHLAQALDISNPKIAQGH